MAAIADKEGRKNCYCGQISVTLIKCTNLVLVYNGLNKNSSQKKIE